MMKLFLLSLAVLVAATALALFVMQDPGYVLFAVGPWTVETSFALLVIGILLSFVVLYFGIRLLKGVFSLPRRIGQRRRQRRGEKAQQALSHGLMELAEGKWKKAERDVLKYADQGYSPILNYLAAARAAQEQGAEDRRDRYLKLAHELEPDADIAVGLTQVELLLEQGKQEQALAALRRLYEFWPSHPKVLKALARLYRELGEWRSLSDLLPRLRKARVYDEQTLTAVTREVYQALLHASEDSDALAGLWEKMPKALREDEILLATYVECLHRFDGDAVAEPLLRAALKRRQSASLLRLYGLVQGRDPVRQLAQGETYLQQNKHDPVALLSAGRIALRNRLWGKAREYLEASVQARPSAEACYELATLLDKMGEHDAALTYYRQGLASSGCCDKPVAAGYAVEKALPAISPPPPPGIDAANA